MHWYFVAWHWIEVHTGILPLTPNRAYNAWSGIGSDIGELAIIGGLVQIARHQNCGVKRCWRFSRHEYDMNGVKHKLCRVHHPGVDETQPLTHQAIKDHHAMLHPAEVVKSRRAANGRFTKVESD